MAFSDSPGVRRPYPKTSSRCSFNKHCRCRAIESRARLQSMAISCATQSANELCKYYRVPQSLSVTAGRLSHNGHRLQVADTIVAAAPEEQAVTTPIHTRNLKLLKVLSLFTERHETTNLCDCLNWKDERIQKPCFWLCPAKTRMMLGKRKRGEKEVIQKIHFLGRWVLKLVFYLFV